MITIVDYGVGNLFSLKSSLRMVGADAMITGDIRTIENADKIIVLDDGCVNGVGTHDELMQNNEIYREVYESQQKGVA